MTPRIGGKPLIALALASAMAASTPPASAQPRGHDGGWHDGPPPPAQHDRGWDRGRGDRGDDGHHDNTGALALQQSQVAPPPAYEPPPGYYGYK